MSRAAAARTSLVLALATVLAGCIATSPSASPTAPPSPSPSVPPSGASTASPGSTTSAAPSADPAPTPGATAVATPGSTPRSTAGSTPGSTPLPTPQPTPVPSPVPLPDGLGDVAWVRVDQQLGADSNRTSTTVAIGRLGKTATTTLDFPAESVVRAWAAGPYVAIAVTDAASTTVSIRRAADGSEVGAIDVPTRLDGLTLDGQGGLVYLARTRTSGGLEIHRYRVDGSGDTRLITLDDRFTPDGIPLDHYGSVIATDGAFVTFACTDRGCRLWQTARGKPASEARILDVPKLCTIVAASPDRLIAYDDSMCFVDTGDADFPLRSIDLSTGASRRISTASQVSADRLMTLDGRPLVVAAVRAGDWSTTDLVTLDARTGARATIVRGLPNADGDHQGWLGLSPMPLPGAWVLMDRWGAGVEPTVAGDGRLVDLASGRVIELPAGTVGGR